ncbi:MAG TPA: phosphatase PAP2 family protein, partial [Acidimicrobiales bacterium]|nr:phosphatase PAP2 family protein [Acidimicrobiales bacterium]
VVSNFYAIAIFAITFGFAAWLWWRRPELYVPLRNCIVLANLMAFAVFWAYPVAPPRMLSGFVDVVAHSGALGWHNDLVKHADQLAAMPSMHMGYAVWCALVAWQAARTRRTKILAVVFGVSYSLLTTWAVIATGNHYLLDVVAGTATTAVAALIVGAAPLLARACRRYVEALLGRPAPARLAQRNVVARTRERLPAQRGARGYTPPPRQGQPPAVSTATSDLKAERAESLG